VLVIGSAVCFRVVVRNFLAQFREVPTGQAE